MALTSNDTMPWRSQVLDTMAWRSQVFDMMAWRSQVLDMMACINVLRASTFDVLYCPVHAGAKGDGRQTGGQKHPSQMVFVSEDLKR